jgi:hypothetical protein
MNGIDAVSHLQSHEYGYSTFAQTVRGMYSFAIEMA